MSRWTVPICDACWRIEVGDIEPVRLTEPIEVTRPATAASRSPAQGYMCGDNPRSLTMSEDTTEALRRAMIESGQPQQICAKAERHWTTDQLREDFIVHGFLAPFIVVTRKSDGVKGSMEFTTRPAPVLQLHAG